MVPVVVDPERVRAFEHGEAFRDRQTSHPDSEHPYPQKKAGKGV